MKNIALSLVAILMLSGCLGAGSGSGSGLLGSNDPAPQPAVSHDAFVASLGTAYIWNCTMTNEAGQVWQFVLANSNSTRWTPVVLREAGARFDLDTETKALGAATIYELRDGSQVLIAADGEARGEGGQASKPHDFPQGQCMPGAQRVVTG